MIRETGLPPAAAALARELHDRQVLPPDPWERLRRLGWLADPSVMVAPNSHHHSFHVCKPFGRKELVTLRPVKKSASSSSLMSSPGAILSKWWLGVQ